MRSLRPPKGGQWIENYIKFSGSIWKITDTDRETDESRDTFII